MAHNNSKDDSHATGISENVNLGTFEPRAMDLEEVRESVQVQTNRNEEESSSEVERETTCADEKEYENGSENAEICKALEIKIKLLHENITKDEVVSVKSLDDKVKNIRTSLAEKCLVEPERVRIIYKGQVLKDDSTLANYKFDVSHSLHAVVRPSQATSTTTATSTTEASQNSNSAQSLPSGNPVQGIGGLLAGILGQFARQAGNARSRNEGNHERNPSNLNCTHELTLINPNQGRSQAVARQIVIANGRPVPSLSFEINTGWSCSQCGNRNQGPAMHCRDCRLYLCADCYRRRRERSSRTEGSGDSQVLQVTADIAVIDTGLLSSALNDSHASEPLQHSADQGASQGLHTNERLRNPMTVAETVQDSTALTEASNIPESNGHNNSNTEGTLPSTTARIGALSIGSISGDSGGFQISMETPQVDDFGDLSEMIESFSQILGSNLRRQQSDSQSANVPPPIQENSRIESSRPTGRSIAGTAREILASGLSQTDTVLHRPRDTLVAQLDRFDQSLHGANQVASFQIEPLRNNRENRQFSPDIMRFHHQLLEISPLVLRMALQQNDSSLRHEVKSFNTSMATLLRDLGGLSHALADYISRDGPGACDDNSLPETTRDMLQEATSVAGRSDQDNSTCGLSTEEQNSRRSSAEAGNGNDGNIDLDKLWEEFADDVSEAGKSENLSSRSDQNLSSRRDQVEEQASAGVSATSSTSGSREEPQNRSRSSNPFLESIREFLRVQTSRRADTRTSGPEDRDLD